MKKIAILGSTGSIGTQTLDVVREHSDELQVVALAAGSNKERLKEQIKEFHPKLVSLSDEKKAQELKEELAGEQVEVVCGMEGLIEVAGADSADVVVTAVVGMMGILPTMEAIKKGKDIALANKETLVTAGHLIIPSYSIWRAFPWKKCRVFGNSYFGGCTESSKLVYGAKDYD